MKVCKKKKIKIKFTIEVFQSRNKTLAVMKYLLLFLQFFNLEKPLKKSGKYAFVVT